MCSRESWLASLRNHAIYQEQMTFPGLPLGQVQAQPFPAFSLVLPAQLLLGYHWVYFIATTNARRGYLPALRGKRAVIGALVLLYLVSCSTCSSNCAILASRDAMVDLNLDLTAPSISWSLLRSSLFCRSSCCLALSFFWAALRSVASSLLSCSAWGRG